MNYGDSLLISKQFPLRARLLRRRGGQSAIAAIVAVFEEDAPAAVAPPGSVMGDTREPRPAPAAPYLAPLLGRLCRRERDPRLFRRRSVGALFRKLSP